SDRLRECDGCKMYFLDNTRGRRRRWCSSASGCGNRAKVRRHRDRKAVSHAPICIQPAIPAEFRSKDA
ncbi:MAG: CGNR zinc finger domain-containing protein, partial [Sphingopyxis sp.]|nr:CGNR zinc finger domain-containing protein [Sphingopyxis sp.]